MIPNCALMKVCTSSMYGVDHIQKYRYLMTGADDDVDILVCVWRTKERCHFEWLRSSRITPANEK